MRDTLFGHRLKKLRKIADLTQEDIARTLNIKIRTYQNHEAGQWPNRQTQEKYISFFKCNKVWFLLGEGDPYPPGPDNKNTTVGIDIPGEERSWGRNVKKEAGKHRGSEDDGEIRSLGAVRSPGVEYGGTSFGEASDGLHEIFNSGNPMLINGIQACISAFQLAALCERQNTQQSKEIKDLKDECDALKKRLADMEKRIKPRDPQEEWKLKERIEALEGQINSSASNLPEKTAM